METWRRIPLQSAEGEGGDGGETNLFHAGPQQGSDPGAAQARGDLPHVLRNQHPLRVHQHCLRGPTERRQLAIRLYSRGSQHNHSRTSAVHWCLRSPAERRQLPDLPIFRGCQHCPITFTMNRRNSLARWCATAGESCQEKISDAIAARQDPQSVVGAGDSARCSAREVVMATTEQQPVDLRSCLREMSADHCGGRFTAVAPGSQQRGSGAGV